MDEFGFQDNYWELDLSVMKMEVWEIIPKNATVIRMYLL